MTAAWNTIGLAPGDINTRWFIGAEADFILDGVADSPLTQNLEFPPNSFIDSIQGGFAWWTHDTAVMFMLLVMPSAGNDRFGMLWKNWGPAEGVTTHPKKAICTEVDYQDLKLWTGTTGIMNVQMYYSGPEGSMNQMEFQLRVGLSHVGMATPSALASLGGGN